MLVFQRCRRCRRVRLCDVRPGMTNVICEVCMKEQSTDAEAADQ